MIVEYNLTNPYLAGTYDGWCQNWQEGSTNGQGCTLATPSVLAYLLMKALLIGLGKSFFVNLTEMACWEHCEADTLCLQGVFEAGVDTAHSQCWLGLTQMKENHSLGS